MIILSPCLFISSCQLDKQPLLSFLPSCSISIISLACFLCAEDSPPPPTKGAEITEKPRSQAQQRAIGNSIKASTGWKIWAWNVGTKELSHADAKAETQEGEEGWIPSPCVSLWHGSVQLRKSMPISHLSIFFCFWIRLQSNKFPHACSCKLNSRCSSSPLFPSINPALLPLSLFTLFHPSLFSSTFCCVLFVTLHPLPKVLPFFKAEEILCQKHSEICCFDIVSSPPLPDSLALSLYTWLSWQLISPPDSLSIWSVPFSDLRQTAPS